MRRLGQALFAALAIIGLATEAGAQDYPSRPIMLIVPFPAGGSTTVMARIIADKLSATLGQQVVVDNRSGAGGTLGTRAVATSAPDGYTLLLGYTGTLAIAPSLYPQAGYDPRKDFAPIGLIGTSPLALLVHPSLPATSVAEFIALAKASPGKIDFASAGNGTVGHVTGEPVSYTHLTLPTILRV